MKNIQALNKLEIFLAHFITESCKKKLDEKGNTKNIIKIIGHRSLNKSFITK